MVVAATIGFSRALSFTLSERVQCGALDFQEALIAAGLTRGRAFIALQRADTKLAQCVTQRVCAKI